MTFADRTGGFTVALTAYSAPARRDGWLRRLCTCRTGQDLDETIVVDRLAASWCRRANWRWCLPSSTDRPSCLAMLAW